MTLFHPQARAARAETRRMRRIRQWVETGRRISRTERAAHNDYDYACTYWFGDRTPASNDERNREFSGTSTTVALRRCVICRPRNEGDTGA